MAKASAFQSSFLGGEWGPYFQGRFDLPKYRTALATCVNSMPLTEGAWTKRSGTQEYGLSRAGAPAGRVLKFELTEATSFTMEFTDGHLRVWNGPGLVFTDLQSVLSISPTNPAVVTTTPQDWADGDYVVFTWPVGSRDDQAPGLRNRQLPISNATSTSFTIPLDGSKIGWRTGTPQMQVGRVLDFATPYTNGSWVNIRVVQDQQVALLLCPDIEPQVLEMTSDPSGQLSVFTFGAAQFTDGPYLDTPNGALLVPDVATGQITYTIAFQTFNPTGATYAKGAFVTYSGVDYKSLQNNNLNHQPDTSPTWWEPVAPGVAWGPSGVTSADIGRHVRVFNAPGKWDGGTSYAAGTAVTWQNTFYTALVGSTGVQPDTDLTKWGVTPYVAQWNWGVIVAVPSSSRFTVQLLDFVEGQYLYTSALDTWRPGAFGGSSSKYPTCGTYTEGRLFLGGAYTNRWDASESNDFFVFTPTSNDGTVADNNAISYTFNSGDQNLITWMHPAQAGIVCGTLGGEWLIQATQMGDPITPTSAQAHRVTKYGCAAIEPRATGLSTVFVQKQKRQLLEFIVDVFSGKYSAPELTLAAKHISVPEVKEIAYNLELVPVVWALKTDGSLAGCTYRRVSAFATEEPTFVGWHRHILGSGRTVQSITEGLTPDGTLPVLEMFTSDGTTGYIEAIQQPFDQGASVLDAWLLDGGVCPQSAVVTAAGVVYSGLSDFPTGATVAAFVGGLDCGDYVVQSDGVNSSITVPFGAAGGKFTLAYLQSLDGHTYRNGSPLTVTATVTPPAPADPGTITILNNTMPAWGTDSTDFAVDWGNNIGYAMMPAGFDDSGIWKFDLALGTYQTKVLTGDMFIDEPMIFGADGLIYCTSGVSTSRKLEQFNSGTLAHIATFGASDLSTIPDFDHMIDPNQMASVQAGDQHFIVAMSGAFIQTLVLDAPLTAGGTAMNHAGRDLAVTGAGGGMAIGQSGPGGGSAYSSTWTSSALKIYTTVIGPTAGQWAPLLDPPAEWVNSTMYSGTDYVQRSHRYFQAKVPNVNETPLVDGTDYWADVTDTGNPDITTTLSVTLTPTDVDPTWPSFDTTTNIMTALWYDRSDGRLIVFAHTLASVPQQSYLLKVDPSTGAIVWRAKIGGTVARVGVNTIVDNNILVIWSTGGGGKFNVVNTATGAFSTYSAPGVSFTGFDGSAMEYNANSGHVVALTDYIGTVGGAPQPSSPITPYSFDGSWAWIDLGGRFQGTSTSAATYTHPALVGYSYTSQGQLLRPIVPQDTGAQDGPAVAKLRRSAQYGAIVSQAGVGSLSIGTSFAKLRSVTFKTLGGTVIQAPALYSGVLWDTLEDDSNFDGQVCWQSSRPIPLTILAIGGFPQTQDK